MASCQIYHYHELCHRIYIVRQTLLQINADPVLSCLALPTIWTPQHFILFSPLVFIAFKVVWTFFLWDQIQILEYIFFVYTLINLNKRELNTAMNQIIILLMLKWWIDFWSVFCYVWFNLQEKNYYRDCSGETFFEFKLVNIFERWKSENGE